MGLKPDHIDSSITVVSWYSINQKLTGYIVILNRNRLLKTESPIDKKRWRHGLMGSTSSVDLSRKEKLRKTENDQRCK